MARLLGYYILHTVVNGIKKLFRTWVAVVLAICLAFGVLGGAVGVLVGSLAEEPVSDTYVEEDEEQLPMTEEDKALMAAVLEAVAGGVILLVLLANIYGGDKSGSHIFTMPDVNLLFTAPMKPQSVLLFRMILQMGTMLVASLYLLFQLPNLVLNVGLSLWMALALLLCWFLTLAVGKLLGVLTYTLAASHPRVRRLIRPAVFATVGVLLALCYGLSHSRGESLPQTALWLFGSAWSRCIPGWGWLKGVIGYAIDGRVLPVVLCVCGTALFGALLVFLTWRMKADFYEDALSHAAEVQQAQAAAQEGRAAKRKKDRSDRLRRDGLSRGSGATVFLYKGIYNRHRFARLGLFTGTGITYLGIGLLCGVFLRWLVGTDGGDPSGLLVIPAAIMLVLAFFRNMGNPLEADLGTHYLFMTPESALKKLLCATLAGSYDTTLDVLPGLVAATLLLGAGPVEALCWLLLIVTLDLFVSALGLFLQMLLPSSLPTQIHAMLQLLLKMLCVVLPLIALIAVSLIWNMVAGLLVTAAVHLVLWLVCFLPAGALLHEGKG